MEDIEDYMTDTISALKETAGGYSERLAAINEKIEKLKVEDREEKEEHAKHEDKRSCSCKIFMDLMKEQQKQEELDKLHQELLQANRDLVTTLTHDTKAYKIKYDVMKKEYSEVLEWKLAAQKKILRCPTVAFDRETKHKDVIITEDGALHNQTSKGKDELHERELTNVTGAVGNKSFTRADIAYFGIKADVQIVRNKHTEKARLYDIFDVYIGSQDLIDKLRDPGVLYQFNMFGINVWYSNMREEVLIDILSSTKHVDRYTLPNKVKHGDKFEVELGFLVDMPRATIHVLDTRERKLIGSVTKVSTGEPLWPAIQIHHCYYEPQYFDTHVNFLKALGDVKSNSEWRKYLLSLVKDREAELSNWQTI